MAKLCINLPPFSPDYSGVASALFDLNCLSILHDASGCTGNYTSYDEPRWYGATSPVMCSGLREIDAVLGDDEKLVNNTIKAAKQLNVTLISIVGSPVPMVIGTDTKGIAREIESSTNIPTIGFETTGTRYYDFGISLALVELAKRFMDKKEKTKLPSINILGANLLDLSSENEFETLKKIIEMSSIELIATIPLNLSFQSLAKARSAWANVVISRSGLELAKYMKEKFNQPYIVSIPIGVRGEKNFIDRINDLFLYKELKPQERIVENPNILIISEQVKANSIREFFGFSRCRVATLFGIEEEIMEVGDFDLSCEDEIISAVNNEQFDLIIGDPLILKLIKKSKATIEIPHYAVSSKLYKNVKINLIGKNGDVFFENKNRRFIKL